MVKSNIIEFFTFTPPTSVFLTSTASRPADLPQDLVSAIAELKRAKRAVILAHYYQDPAIQDVADFIGDSLELSRQAAQTEAEVILFAGVHFMAETAKILNPDKAVLLPDLNAGCSLADSCPQEAFAQFRACYPDHFVVSYINCSAAVKAMSDLICTSANAVSLIQQIPPEQPILFAPDQNLGRYVMAQTGRPMVLWPGSCIVHETFSERQLWALKAQYPAAEVIAHPECEAPVLALADFIGSTSRLLSHVQTSPSTTFIVVTEPGIIHQMHKRAPHKQFIPAPAQNGCLCNECPYMRLNTLEKVYQALRDGRPALTLPETVMAAARAPIQRMLDWSRPAAPLSSVSASQPMPVA